MGHPGCVAGVFGRLFGCVYRYRKLHWRDVAVTIELPNVILAASIHADAKFGSSIHSLPTKGVSADGGRTTTSSRRLLAMTWMVASEQNCSLQCRTSDFGHTVVHRPRFMSTRPRYYLASCHSRRAEMRQYREQLESFLYWADERRRIQRRKR